MNEVEALNEFCTHSMIGLLGITFTGIHPESIQATMPVDNKTCQPNGWLHGGASLALAESMAGAGSYLLVDRDKFNVLGLQISGNHVSSVDNGMVYADGQLVHKGKTTHIWEVKIKDKEGKLISMVRVTNIITEKQ
jgi:hypothetical protein